MNTEKMKEVFSEEAFVKALFEMESVAEMQEALSSKGIQLSEEEVAGIRTLFAKMKSGEISREQLAQWSALAENGELSEEMLEQVAGGSITVIGCIVAAVGLLFMVGFGIAEGEWQKAKLAEKAAAKKVTGNS